MKRDDDLSKVSDIESQGLELEWKIRFTIQTHFREWLTATDWLWRKWGFLKDMNFFSKKCTFLENTRSISGLSLVWNNILLGDKASLDELQTESKYCYSFTLLFMYKCPDSFTSSVSLKKSDVVFFVFYWLYSLIFISSSALSPIHTPPLTAVEPIVNLCHIRFSSGPLLIGQRVTQPCRLNGHILACGALDIACQVHMQPPADEIIQNSTGMNTVVFFCLFLCFCYPSGSKKNFL